MHPSALWQDLIAVATLDRWAAGKAGTAGGWWGRSWGWGGNPSGGQTAAAASAGTAVAAGQPVKAG